MRKSLLTGAVMAASILMAGAANATTVDFAYDQAGNPVATGAFTYTTGATGVLGYADLTAFSVTIGSMTYTLADVTPLTDYVQFAYDTATNMLNTNTNACGFAGCGFQESLGAINSTGTFGFFFNPAPGSGHEYANGNQFVFDTLELTPAGGVPEPATWAMLLLGFLGLGAAVRGQRRKVLAVA